MARNHIVERLVRLLSDGPIDNEVRAVYLLVELRKILDHAYSGLDQPKFLLLRFYCDWIVHTEKSRNLGHIAPIVQKAYDDVKMRIEQGPYSTPGKEGIVEFIYMDALKGEMENLFTIERATVAPLPTRSVGRLCRRCSASSRRSAHTKSDTRSPKAGTHSIKSRMHIRDVGV
jgi:hypothetical protein